MVPSQPMPLGSVPDAGRDTATGRPRGVLGGLRRMLSDGAGLFHRPAVAPHAAEALDTHLPTLLMTRRGDLPPPAIEPGAAKTAAVVPGVVVVRTASLPERPTAASGAEVKATLEVVGLMFQPLLAEERLPAPVRVWFARLQLPVLRVALAEPAAFALLDHPARRLVDRMGAAVMGFQASGADPSALQTEIQRIVLTIEQYPEAGQRVFQTGLREFQAFLDRHEAEANAAAAGTVSQQVEQKEALAIQYTIELRDMLADVPMREEIRVFLFRVWAEVLAVAALRHGPQDPQAVALRQVAADLVWAASAHAGRAERERVAQTLPTLLEQLRGGMRLLGLDAPAQEEHLRSIAAILDEGAGERVDALPPWRVDALAKTLAPLEALLTEGLDVTDPMDGDVPLTQEAIEMMLGIDASMIELMSDAEATEPPTDSMLARARLLEPGHWFALSWRGTVRPVQYLWHSPERQLHLFASADGHALLVQLKPLALWLHHGQLAPAEAESLTERATRDALSRLAASPDLLLV